MRNQDSQILYYIININIFYNNFWQREENFFSFPGVIVVIKVRRSLSIDEFEYLLVCVGHPNDRFFRFFFSDISWYPCHSEF